MDKTPVELLPSVMVDIRLMALEERVSSLEGEEVAASFDDAPDRRYEVAYRGALSELDQLRRELHIAQETVRRLERENAAR